MIMFFFFNDTATTEIYTLSLHDALPISALQARRPDKSVRPDTHRRPPSLRNARGPRRASALPSRRGATCRSEEHTSELQSQSNLVCRLLLEKKKSVAH